MVCTAPWVKCIFKELTDTQWAERQREGKLDDDMIMPSHYFISSIAPHTLSLVGLCEPKSMPVQRYVAHRHGVQIHPSEFIIIRKRTRGGWNVNSP